MALLFICGQSEFNHTVSRSSIKFECTVISNQPLTPLATRPCVKEWSANCLAGEPTSMGRWLVPESFDNSCALHHLHGGSWIWSLQGLNKMWTALRYLDTRGDHQWFWANLISRVELMRHPDATRFGARDSDTERTLVESLSWKAWAEQGDIAGIWRWEFAANITVELRRSKHLLAHWQFMLRRLRRQTSLRFLFVQVIATWLTKRGKMIAKYRDSTEYCYCRYTSDATTKQNQPHWCNTHW